MAFGCLHLEKCNICISSVKNSDRFTLLFIAFSLKLFSAINTHKPPITLFLPQRADYRCIDNLHINNIGQ